MSRLLVVIFSDAEHFNFNKDDYGDDDDDSDGDDKEEDDILV